MSRGPDRLVRQALRGDKVAALRWHEANKDRFKAFTRPWLFTLGPHAVADLPDPVLGRRIGGAAFSVQAGVEGPDMDGVEPTVSITGWLGRAALLDDDWRSMTVYDVFTKWRVLPSGKVSMVDVSVQDPETDEYYRGTSEKHGPEIGDLLRPHVLAWAEKHADAIKHILAMSLALEARELANDVAELEETLARKRSMLSDVASDEILVRFAPWRPR